MMVTEVQYSSARAHEMFATSGAINSNAPCAGAPVLAIGSAEQTVPHRLWARLKDPVHFALSKDHSCPVPVPPRNKLRPDYQRRLGQAAYTVCQQGNRLHCRCPLRLCQDRRGRYRYENHCECDNAI